MLPFGWRRATAKKTSSTTQLWRLRLGQIDYGFLEKPEDGELYCAIMDMFSKVQRFGPKGKSFPRPLEDYVRAAEADLKEMEKDW